MVAGERGEGVTESQRNRIKTRAASRAMVISRTLITKFLGTKGRRVIACKGRNRVQFLLFSTPSLPTPLPAGCETFAVKLNNEVPLNRKKKKEEEEEEAAKGFHIVGKFFPSQLLRESFRKASSATCQRSPPLRPLPPSTARLPAPARNNNFISLAVVTRPNRSITRSDTYYTEKSCKKSLRDQIFSRFFFFFVQHAFLGGGTWKLKSCTEAKTTEP